MFDPHDECSYDEFGAAEIELLQTISGVPVLSRGLRDRVLNAALKSRRRLLIFRRVVSAACLCLAVSVFACCCLKRSPTDGNHPAGSRSLFGTACDYAQLTPATPIKVLENHIETPNDLIALTEIGSWGHVDAEFRIREMHRHSLRQSMRFP